LGFGVRRSTFGVLKRISMIPASVSCHPEGEPDGSCNVSV